MTVTAGDLAISGELDIITPYQWTWHIMIILSQMLLGLGFNKQLTAGDLDSSWHIFKLDSRWTWPYHLALSLTISLDLDIIRWHYQLNLTLSVLYHFLSVTLNLSGFMHELHNYSCWNSARKFSPFEVMKRCSSPYASCEQLLACQ